MNEKAKTIAKLILRHLQENLTESEKAQLNSWIEASEHNRLQFQQLTNKEGFLLQLKNKDKEKKVRKLIAEHADLLVPVLPLYRRFYFKVLATVFGIILIGVVAWIQWGHQPDDRKAAQVDNRFKNDIQPGGDNAKLVLANGSTIILDSAENGTVAEQGNTKILKLGNGKITYNQSGKINVAGQLKNTVYTPRGGQYQITLPDGSQVWLNAESSLSFPTTFSGRSRNVELKGEAYFEVAKNPKQPFKVLLTSATNNNKPAEVEVLGTHFNINSYADEKIIKTTLLEGSVKISTGNISSRLTPGQQGWMSDNNEIKIIPNADLDEAIAWKNGKFQFKDLKIEAIMRQLARWYDLDIIYEGNSEREFVGEIPRNVMLSNVFKILEATGRIEFKIEGKKVTVISK